MPDFDFAKYRPLLAEALEAYRTDSSYAEDMAKQAGILRSRTELKRQQREDSLAEAS